MSRTAPYPAAVDGTAASLVLFHSNGLRGINSHCRFALTCWLAAWQCCGVLFSARSHVLHQALSTVAQWGSPAAAPVFVPFGASVHSTSSPRSKAPVRSSSFTASAARSFAVDAVSRPT